MFSKLQCCYAVCCFCLVHSTLYMALQSDLVILFLFYVANHALYSLLSLTLMLVAYAVWLYLNPGSLNPVDMGSYDWGEASIAELSLDELIKKVSKNIGRDWKPLARKLEFEETEIDAIEERDPKNLNEQLVHFFDKWKRMKGNHASNDVLLEAITSIPLSVEKICGLTKMGVYQSTTIPQLPPPKPLQLPSSFTTHGLELIAQESNVESNTIEFSWKGLKLTFNTATTFTVGVVGAGHIVLPDGTELVTALYYIGFNTEGETTSCDVWMELQHCACVVKDYSQNTKLRFVVTQLPTKSLPYELSLCTEKMSAISSLSGMVRLACLSSKQGYLVGIVKPWSRYFIFANSNSRSKYYLRALVHSVGDGEYEMHIVVVKKVDPIMQMIDSKYPPDQFVRYGEIELTLLEHSPKPFFQSSLTISSLTTLSKNWRGSFISSTTIPRSRLESPESYTESATLQRVTAHFRQNTSSHTPSRLECKIKLSGTASPHACSNLILRQDCSTCMR